MCKAKTSAVLLAVILWSVILEHVQIVAHQFYLHSQYSKCHLHSQYSKCQLVRKLLYQHLLLHSHLLRNMLLSIQT